MKDNHNFVNVKEVFDQPWFAGSEKRTKDYLEYCAELNLKHGWTLDTVYQMMMEVTA